jgi:hypothetical protein
VPFDKQWSGWETSGGMLVLGVVAIVVVAAGMALALRLASRQEIEETPPSSVPSDFVAPVSSGGYAWRGTDESEQAFKDRVARENAPPKG